MQNDTRHNMHYKAYKGEKLPTDQYHALREEQADLRAKVGHN